MGAKVLLLLESVRSKYPFLVNVPKNHFKYLAALGSAIIEIALHPRRYVMPFHLVLSQLLLYFLSYSSGILWYQ